MRSIFALVIGALMFCASVNAHPPSPRSRAPMRLSANLDSMKDAMKARRREAMTIMDEDEISSMESSAVFPISAIGMTPLPAAQLAAAERTEHHPFGTSHFSWTSSLPDREGEHSIDDEHIAEEERKDSVSSIPSIPSLPHQATTRSGSLSSASFPFPSQSERNPSVHLHASPASIGPSFPTPPLIPEEVKGPRIDASHYHILPSGDFYCSRCGYTLRNPHKVC